MRIKTQKNPNFVQKTVYQNNFTCKIKKTIISLKKIFMKKVSTILLLLIAGAGIIFAGVTFQYFTGRPNSDGILLEWKTGDEGDTKYFDIERSANTPDNFLSIKTINATGSNSYYSYQDNSVYKSSPTSSSLYYYRLKCVYQNGNYSFTNPISVVHSVSGIKTTWGSIKAIFR